MTASRRWCWWFLGLGLVVGLAFAILVPPAQQPDETAHFLRVWTLARGDVAPHVDAAGDAGAVVPACVGRYGIATSVRAYNPDPYRVADLWRSGGGCRGLPRMHLTFSNTAVNSPIAYLGPVAAVAVLSHAGASVPVQYLGGRLAGLAVYLAIVWAALRIAPRGQVVLFVVGCLPVSLMLAAALSADGMSIALSILAVALLLRLRDDDTTRIGTVVAFGAVLVLLALCKNTYGPFVLLIFLVPSGRFGAARWQRLVGRFGAVALTAAATVWWAWQVRGIEQVVPAATQPLFFGDLSVPKQTSWVLHHPGGFLSAVVRTVFSGQTTSLTIPGLVQFSGVYHPPHAATEVGALAPAWEVALLLTWLVVVMAGLARRRWSEGGRWTHAGAVPAAVVAAVTVAVLLLIEFGVYVSVNVVGGSRVRLVQGRYFIELLPLLALVAGRARVQPAGGARLLWFERVAVGGSVVFLAIAAVSAYRFSYS